jgi:glycosyltransferase involved in cell wall biosynthesis
MDLLKAFKKLEHKDVYLVMMGEGVLRHEMQAFIHEYALHNVILTGFVNQSEIDKYYAMADIFVLPSGAGETWGLVVNEAMLFGLPVIVSSTAGCAIDLVKDGVNGKIFSEGDVAALADCLSRFILDARLRESAGKKSRAIIEAFDHRVTVENISKELNLMK